MALRNIAACLMLSTIYFNSGNTPEAPKAKAVLYEALVEVLQPTHANISHHIPIPPSEQAHHEAQIIASPAAHYIMYMLLFALTSALTGWLVYRVAIMCAAACRRFWGMSTPVWISSLLTTACQSCIPLLMPALFGLFLPDGHWLHQQQWYSICSTFLTLTAGATCTPELVERVLNKSLKAKIKKQEDTFCMIQGQKVRTQHERDAASRANTELEKRLASKEATLQHYVDIFTAHETEMTRMQKLVAEAAEMKSRYRTAQINGQIRGQLLCLGFKLHMKPEDVVKNEQEMAGRWQEEAIALISKLRASQKERLSLADQLSAMEHNVMLLQEKNIRLRGQPQLNKDWRYDLEQCFGWELAIERYQKQQAQEKVASLQRKVELKQAASDKVDFELNKIIKLRDDFKQRYAFPEANKRPKVLDFMVKMVLTFQNVQVAIDQYRKGYDLPEVDALDGVERMATHIESLVDEVKASESRIDRLTDEVNSLNETCEELSAEIERLQTAPSTDDEPSGSVESGSELLDDKKVDEDGEGDVQGVYNLRANDVPSVTANGSSVPSEHGAGDEDDEDDEQSVRDLSANEEPSASVDGGGSTAAADNGENNKPVKPTRTKAKRAMKKNRDEAYALAHPLAVLTATFSGKPRDKKQDERMARRKHIVLDHLKQGNMVLVPEEPEQAAKEDNR